jgi:hypothetical protein
MDSHAKPVSCVTLHWKVDECSAYFNELRVRGWCFNPISPIVGVEAIFPEPLTVVRLASFGLESLDVAVSVDPMATHCRFDEWLVLPSKAIGRDFVLRFTFADKVSVQSGSVLENACAGDPYFACWVTAVRYND